MKGVSPQPAFEFQPESRTIGAMGAADGMERGFWQRLADWPASSLPACLAMGLLVRLPAVLFADGYEYVDQQYQNVDPAWHLATGEAWTPTWEWIDGIRSWVYPWFLAGLFRGGLAIGVDDPLVLMRWVRFTHALIGLLPLALLYSALVRWPRPSNTTVRTSGNAVMRPGIALWLVAVSGLLVTTAVQPSGPALGATLAVAAVVAFHGRGVWPAVAGLLLGLAFCCRFQEAVFGPAVVLVGLWQRRFRAVLWFSAMTLPGIALQGVVDIAMGGAFLSTPWRYFEFNVLLGASQKWDAEPWWFYLAAGVVPAFAFVPPWLGVAWRRLRAGAGLLPAALVAGGLHVLAHSCVGRKALRFEYGALGLLVVVMAVGVALVPGREGGRSPRWQRSHGIALFVVHGLLWVWASLVPGHLGPIRMAEALRGEPEFHGELLVVGGDATSIGGACYLRRPRLAIAGIAIDEVAERARAGVQWFVAVRHPLATDVQDAAGLELVGSYHGLFGLRRGDRRFVYRRGP
ncbi:MAG: hypothetical protein NXI31_07385 [bacterium]|nr:hypothetical protein [bacterium]